MKKMTSMGLIASGMLMGMGVLYMLECKQQKSIDQMICDAQNAIDDMMD